MTALEDARRLSIERLDAAEANALQLQEASGRSQAVLIAKIHRQKDLLMGTAAPMKVQVSVPAGSSRAQRNGAIIAAVLERLNSAEGSR